jgi:hypothetical protein
MADRSKTKLGAIAALAMSFLLGILAANSRLDWRRPVHSVQAAAPQAEAADEEHGAKHQPPK